MRLALPIRRTTALLLALAWVLPVVEAVTHSEDHGHRYCVEHQAFEEGAAGEVAERADPDALGSVASASTPEEGAVAAHAPCPVTNPASRDAMAGAQRVSSVERAASSPSVATSDDASHAPLAVLSFAPKASPPESRG